MRGKLAGWLEEEQSRLVSQDWRVIPLSELYTNCCPLKIGRALRNDLAKKLRKMHKWFEQGWIFVVGTFFVSDILIKTSFWSDLLDYLSRLIVSWPSCAADAKNDALRRVSTRVSSANVHRPRLAVSWWFRNKGSLFRRLIGWLKCPDPPLNAIEGGSRARHLAHTAFPSMRERERDGKSTKITEEWAWGFRLFPRHKTKSWNWHGRPQFREDGRKIVLIDKFQITNKELWNGGIDNPLVRSGSPAEGLLICIVPRPGKDVCFHISKVNRRAQAKYDNPV